MNERLKELLEQATEVHDYWYKGESQHIVNHKMFAELIVQECMDIVSDESEKVSDEWRCKDGKHIWWKIKEHFGVE